VDFMERTTTEKIGTTKIHDRLYLVYRDVNGKETMSIYDDHPNIGRFVEMSMGDVVNLVLHLDGFLQERKRSKGFTTIA
jgi:hypothetical protein